MWTAAGREKGLRTRWATAETRRLTLRCPWLGCEHEAVTYRSQTVWGGKRGRTWIFCPEHRELVRRITGGSGCMNGYGRVFANPDRIYATRTAQPAALRVAVFVQHGERCATCQLPLLFSEQGQQWWMDHTVPVYQGGMTTLRNLAPLCKRCHLTKTRGEIQEIRRLKPKSSPQWATHAMKDVQIAALKSEIAELKAALLAKGAEGCGS